MNLETNREYDETSPRAAQITPARRMQIALTSNPVGESEAAMRARAQDVAQQFLDMRVRAASGVNPNATDLEMRAEAFSYSRLLTGSEDPLLRMWTPDRKGYGPGQGREALERMRGFVLDGEERRFTPRYRAYWAKDQAGRRAEALENRKTLDTFKRAVGDAATAVFRDRPDEQVQTSIQSPLSAVEMDMDPPDEVRKANETLRNPFGHWIGGAPDGALVGASDVVRRFRAGDAYRAAERERYEAQVQRDYEAELSRENAWNEISLTLGALAKNGETDAYDCVKAVMESPDNRLPETHVAKFMNLSDEMKMAVVRTRTMLRTHVEGGFVNAVEDAAIGAANVALGVATGPARQANKVRMASAGLDVNEIAKRRQYLYQATGDFGAKGAPEDIPQMQFEQVCEDHGLVAEAVIGAVSTLPYMGAAAIPYAGPALVALEAMNEMDDHVAMNGGDITDPDYIVSSAVFGGLYAYTERLQMEGLLGDISDKELRLSLLKGLWSGIKDGRAVRHAAVGTVSESVQEGVQNGIMEVNNALALKQDAVRAFAEGFTQDFVGSLGTMLVVEGGGIVAGHAKRSGLSNPLTSAGREAGRAARGADLEETVNQFSALQEMVRAEDRGDVYKVGYELNRLAKIWKAGGADALVKDGGLAEERANEVSAYLSELRAAGETSAAADEATPDSLSDENAKKLETISGDYLSGKTDADATKGELLKVGFGESGAQAWMNWAGHERNVRGQASAIASALGLSYEETHGTAGAQAGDLASVRRSMEELDFLRRIWADGSKGVRMTSKDGKTISDPGAKALELQGFTKEAADRLSLLFHRERAAAYSKVALDGVRALYDAKTKGKVDARAAMAARFGGRFQRIRTGVDADGKPTYSDFITFTAKDGSTSLVEFTESPTGAPDFSKYDASVAESIEDATKSSEKPVTMKDWKNATPEERERIWKENRLYAEGDFTPNAHPVELSVPGDPHARVSSEQAAHIIGRITVASESSGAEVVNGLKTGYQSVIDNSVAFHETFHAFSHFASTSGIWTEEDVKRLCEKYGDPGEGVRERFNEETGAEAFRAFNVRRMNGALTEEDQKSPFMKLVALARDLRGASAEAATNARRAQTAEDALFDQIMLDRHAAVPDMNEKRQEPDKAAPTVEKTKTTAAPTATAAPTPAAPTQAAPTQAAPTQAAPTQAAPTPAAPTPAAPKTWRASTPRGGVKVGGHYVVVPLSELVHSNHPLYAKHADKQERNRVDNKLEEQVRLNIVNEFDGERLLEASDTANGAPIVFLDEAEDGRRHYFVLSGNGRVMVLNELNARHLYDKYRNPMKAWAAANGVQVPEGDTPVLVRVVTDLGGSSLKEVARLSNKEATTRYTETEQARVDAENIVAAGIAGLYRANANGTADMTPGVNDEFFSRFAGMEGGESILDENNNVTEDGRHRIVRAFLTIACGQGERGPATVKKLITMADTLDIGRQRNAAQFMAPAVAQLERNPSYAIGPDVSRAMADFMSYTEQKRAGKIGTLDDFMAQDDMFDPRSAIAGELLKLFASRQAARDVADYVSTYCDVASKSDADGSLGGSSNARTREDVWREAAKLTEERHAKAKEDAEKARHSFASARHDELMKTSPEYRSVFGRYHNADGSAKPGWLKAPNGKDTNLEPYQWVQVRTPSFLKWFGDWKTGATLKAVESMSAIGITQRQSGMTVENAYSNLGEGVNEIDGRRVRFVNSTLGKIIRHKGFDTQRIVHQLKDVFDKSIPILSENEKEIVRPDGTIHKRHPNFAGYHTYLGKITDGTNSFYVRFTVQEEKTRKKDYNPNAVHSTFVSDIAIYNDGKALSQSTTKVGESELSRTDDILSQILSDLNAKYADSSKIVDENGEPLVVYHGTPSEFDEFKYGDHGFWFTPNERSAKRYAAKDGGTGFVVPVFLDVKRPTEERHPYLEGRTDEKADWREWLEGDDYDGWICRDGERIFTVVVKDAAKVKSATDNTGAFDGADPRMRWSVVSLASGQRVAVVDRIDEIAKIDLNDQNSVHDYLVGMVGNTLFENLVVGAESPTEYIFSDDAKGNNKRIRKAKSKLATSLDEAASVSSKPSQEPSAHKVREGGLYYRRSFTFAVPSGFSGGFRAYAADMVSYMKNGVEQFYDVVNIKDAPSVSADLTRLSARIAVAGTSRIPADGGATEGIVPQSPEQVNGKIDGADPRMRFSFAIGFIGSANFHTSEWELNNLATAREMLAKFGDGTYSTKAWNGLSRDEKVRIKIATGWEVGVEGQWRLEVPDELDGVRLHDILHTKSESFERKKAEVELAKNELMSLFENLSGETSEEELNRYSDADRRLKDLNSQLERMSRWKSFYLSEIFPSGSGILTRYPQLKSVGVVLDNKLGFSIRGFLDENAAGEPIIRLNAIYMETDGDVRKTLVHEIQHFIQRLEGFATGGNLAVGKEVEDLEESAWREEDRRVTRENFKDKESLDDLLSAAGKKEQVEELLQESIRIKRPRSEYVRMRAEILDSVPGYREKEAEVNRRIVARNIEFEKKTDSRRRKSKFGGIVSGQSGYFRLGGEVESRNVSSRDARAILARMDEFNERLLLEDTEDVRREDQAVWSDLKKKIADIRPEMLSIAEDLERHEMSGSSARLSVSSARPTADDVFTPAADDTLDVPVSSLLTMKNEPERSVLKAAEFMGMASRGEAPKRAPVSVADNGDGTYTVIDGNATSLAMAALGGGNVRVRVLGPAKRTRLENSEYAVENLATDLGEDGNLHTKGLDGLEGEAAREEAYRQAEENVPLLERIVQTALRGLNRVEKTAGSLMRGPNRSGDPREIGKAVKKRARVDEKAKGDYGGDYSRVVDLIGGTIILKDNGDYADAVKKTMKASEEVGARVVKVKKFNMKPGDVGYRDVKLSIRFGNGGIGEVIVVNDYINEAKFNRGGHDLYDVQRVLDTDEKKKNPDIARTLKLLDDLEEALYSRGEEAPQADAFARMYANASSAVHDLVSGSYTPAAFLSEDDIKLLKSWSSESHLAIPPSVLSYATPALSLMKYMSASSFRTGAIVAQFSPEVNGENAEISTSADGAQNQVKNPEAPSGMTSPESAARASIRAAIADGGQKEAESALANYVAYFELSHGGVPQKRTLARMGLAMGMKTVAPDDLLRKGASIAEQMRGTLIERAAKNGDVATTLALLKRETDMDAALDDLVAGAAGAGGSLTHKGVGKMNDIINRRVEQLMRDFSAASLADMEGETGLDIAAEILANDPSAFDKELKKKGLDPNDAAQTADDQEKGDGEDGEGGDGEEEGAELTDRQKWEREQRRREAEAKVAKFIAEAKKRAEERKAAAERLRQKRAADEAASGNADGETSGASGDAETARPLADDVVNSGGTVRADFKDPREFAAFLRVWAADRFARTHGLTSLGKAEENRLFAEFYRICVRRELNDLAQKLLAPKGARAWVNRRLQDLEKGVKPDVVEGISADVFAFINRAAIRENRAALVQKFKHDLKERYFKGTKFDEFKQDTDRKVTGWVEEAARYICRVCDLSKREINGEPSQLQKERAELRDIIDRRAEVYDESGKEVAQAAVEDAETRKALWKLALLDKFGAMTSLMPGEIIDLQDAAFRHLETQAADLEAKWKETRELQERIRGDLTEAVVAPNGQRYQEKGWLNGRLFDALNGLIRLRLKHLTRFASEDVRKKADESINEIIVMLGDGETLYARALQDDRTAFFTGLAEIFRKPGGGADNKAIKAYLERMDTPIPEDLSRRISNQGFAGTMTYGQMLQLLVSLEQRSFRDAVEENGREGQANLIRNYVGVDENGNPVRAFTANDEKFVAWLRAFYEAKRETISKVTERMVGQRVDSPDPLYCPVRRLMDDRARGLHSDPTPRWDPIAKVFSRRVENLRDFDETRSLVSLFFEASEESAKLVAWAERGSIIRNVFTSVGVQSAIRRAFGPGELGKILKQLEATFNGGESRNRTPGELAAVDKAMNFATYAYLGFNPLSALKQTTSFTVWANALPGGFRDLWKYMTHFDGEVVKHLKESDEYKVRYGNDVGSGQDMATKGLYENPSMNPVARLFSGAGMWLLKKGDFVPGIWIAQGYYKDALNRNLSKGLAFDAADRRAVTETFNLLEETQQSGRTYNTNMLAIEHGRIARFLTQFATSPLQQLQYETQAWREWRDMVRYGMGEKRIAEARQRLLRAVIINHVLIPAALELVISAYRLAMGEEPPWEKEGAHWDFLTEILMGQFGRVFFMGAFAQTTLNAVFKRQAPRGGEILPTEGLLGMAAKVGFMVHDFATCDVDRLRKDLEQAARGSAATRTAYNVFRRVTGDSDEDRKAERERAKKR